MLLSVHQQIKDVYKRQSKNSHIEAVLGNDEHIVVTRSYIAGIKEAFAR